MELIRAIKERLTRRAHPSKDVPPTSYQPRVYDFYNRRDDLGRGMMEALANTPGALRGHGLVRISSTTGLSMVVDLDAANNPGSNIDQKIVSSNFR